MLATIHLYDTHRVKDSDYQVMTFNCILTQRQIRDIFTTDWLELNPFDYICYDQLYNDYDYCKVFLDHVLVYSGTILETNELQSKFKHLTRQDSSNGETNDKTKIKKI